MKCGFALSTSVISLRGLAYSARGRAERFQRPTKITDDENSYSLALIRVEICITFSSCWDCLVLHVYWTYLF